jgi:arylsulfatase
MEFLYDGGGLGKGGTVSLFINDKKVGQGRIPFTNWVKFTLDETFDIGEDSGAPVSEDYASPNRFTGTIKRIVVDIQPTKLSAVDQEKIQAMERSARLMVE